MNKLLIGFIGQGFIGKHMADDFALRGFNIVRYSNTDFVSNREKIQECDVVFIAVPTPTTPSGFDDSIIREVVKLVGEGKVAVIKSTILPGTTESIQKENPGIFVLHSPEFLTEKNARHDTSFPERNIVGIPEDTEDARQKARLVMEVLPKAPFELVTNSKNAECVKYIGNSFLYTKVVFMNMAHDFVSAAGADWETVRKAAVVDPRIGESHTSVVHTSGHVEKAGRGAGGHCFIKDFESFINFYEEHSSDKNGLEVLKALRHKNNALLAETGKDLDILSQVYGNDIK